ncbi:MAG: hypothetical protein IPH13_05555 [Planctomycetes bacterium]|nr:hypothetical protein [Planctomycetota bacterium]MCC7172447.1 hypothetical protein [Planctomycetota bacterium]
MNSARTLTIGMCASLILLAAEARATTTFAKVAGTLKLTGDAQNDAVQLVGIGNPGSVVLVVDAQQVGSFEGIHDIVVNTAAGDDVLEVLGVQIGGSIKIKTGTGVDDVRIHGDNGHFERSLFVGGNVDVSMGRQAGDTFELKAETAHGVSIGGNVVVRGASFNEITGFGGTADLDATDVRIGGNLRIQCGVAANSGILLVAVNVHGSTKLDTGNQADSVSVASSQFLRPVTIRTFGGDDIIGFSSGAFQNRFASTLVIDGGAGADQWLGATASIQAIAPNVKNVETSS